MHQGGGSGASDGAELRETIVELKETNEVGPSSSPYPWFGIPEIGVNLAYVLLSSLPSG